MIYLSSPTADGTGCGCSCDCPGNIFSVYITLDWSCVWDWDLHLSLPDGSEVYYGSVTSGGFTLNYDAYPCCNTGNTPPFEIITGNGHCYGNYQAYRHDYGSGGCCPQYDSEGNPLSTWCDSVFSGTLTVLAAQGLKINGTFYARDATFTIEDGVSFDVERPD